jgi:hypothetical protein
VTSTADVAQTARCLLRNIDKRKVGGAAPNLDSDQLGVTMHLMEKAVNGCLAKKHETILKSVLNGHNFSREPFLGARRPG